jgi:hypothetical protein
MYVKGVFGVFKILQKLGIKPKDIIGVGGDVVKMGKSLFNTRVNPKLIKFIEKNGKIPTKIVEQIKIHARTLKNTSESQKKLFEVNIKDILNAKNAKTLKSPVTSVQRPATSVKEQATEAFKGWIPKVIKGGKDKLATGGIANHFRERVGFADVNVQTLNALFPDTDPTSDDFKPIDVPGIALPVGLTLGGMRLKDIFFSKDKEESKKDIVERIEKVEKDRKEPNQEPPKDPKDQLLESIKLANEVRKLKKEKDRQIFSERMHGEAGGKGIFTGSGTDRKSIAPPGFTPKDKNILALFRNNKNLEGLETKTINSLMEFRKNPELFYERVKELKARGVDFDALYNPAEIAELLGLKTASGITDAIVSKNIPFEKIGAFKAVKLNDYLNSQIATIEKFKDVAPKGKEDAQRTDVMSEFRGLYSKFKDLRMDIMPKTVRKIYDKYNLSEVEGGHPNPLIFFSKKWKDGKLTNEREFDWIYRNKDKLLNKDNVVFQSKALNQKGGPFYDLIKDLKEQYRILGPLVDKYEGKGRVTNKEDKKIIEAANKAITDIVAQSQFEVDDWLNKTGKYENRESKASDILSIARMKEGGLHGNMFDTTTGEVVLYTGAGEGAGTASGAADEETLNVKLNTFSNYIDVLTNVIEDKKDKQILIEYFSDKVLPKFNKGGPVLSGVDQYIVNRGI